MNTTTFIHTTVDHSAQKFIRLSMFRKNGQGVSTPVTFAPHNGRLYIVTGVKSGKIKRLRISNWIEFAPCDRRVKVLGPSIKGQARILTNEESARLKPYLRFRAGNLLMFFMNRLRDLRQGEIST